MDRTPQSGSEGKSQAKALKPAFASFWHGGELSPYELACIRSFTAKGYEFTLFSYAPGPKLPPGVIQGDATQIADKKYLDAFIVRGKPSLSHFTDYFRLCLIKKTDLIWCDVDIVLLNDFSLDNMDLILGYESPSSICNAVLRMESASPFLDQIIGRIQVMAGKEAQWGATGPRLLTEICDRPLKKFILRQNIFYPVHWDEYYKVFLPEFNEECRELCKNSLTLHLWNNLIDKTGIWKKIGPPVGSYLYDLFSAAGAIEYFTEFYPPRIMNTMVENAMVHAGPDAGIIKVLRFIWPGILNTIRRRL